MNPDIRKALRKITPVLVKAQEENLNEADTVQRLVMFAASACASSRYLKGVSIVFGR